ncbi:major facilitator superfamily domain-containing protein [Neohortaea acidophila]|uniref:Major facilitator superfamily domain-containing protein n=1 Tax=Neohortaea acidophila TaxID=245834 RepID=A0A6A6PKB9_9PEZI|nr:major facilitator superfamily domain-containing protein [Neohortaea acidophila]KAF2480141.1 major facilitator superfamily domain-containing protein [Neohortaea acidophila]
MADNGEDVQGTLRIYSNTDDFSSNSHHIIFEPQPTDSPNDPINWNVWRKSWHAFLVLWIVGFTAATSNIDGCEEYGEKAELGISWSSQNLAAGILFLGIGYATWLLAPVPSLYGRRLVYLICLIWSLIGTIWLANVQTTQDALWNQLFVGASEAVGEATAQLSLSDIFFQHQRGASMGLYLFSTSVGTYLGPLLGGFVADGVGWRWVGWSSAIITSVALVVFYFGFEETSFDRSVVRLRGVEITPGESVEIGPRQNSGQMDRSPEKATEKESEKDVVLEAPDVQIEILETVPTQSVEKEKSYFQRIALVTRGPVLRGTGFKQYIKELWLVAQVFLFPAVWYSGLQWGAQDAWLSFYLNTEEDVWVGAPWNYSNNAAAIMNVPTLIGAMVGCLWGGWFSDYFVLWMARRHGGVAEAEHRLWLVLPAAVISPAGLMLFGIGTGEGWAWPAPYVGLGMIGFGWGCGGDLSMAYLQDAYPKMVLEGMVGVSVINNSIGAIFSIVTGSWETSQGSRKTYITIGVLSFACMMLTLPMMYWGKKCRRMTQARYNRYVNTRDRTG